MIRATVPASIKAAVKLKLEGEPETIAVYKPKRGESPLWDFPSGTLYKREYAAYLASRMLTHVEIWWMEAVIGGALLVFSGRKR